MAYKNLVKVLTTGKEETFQRLRDFICKRNGTYDYSTTGIGWTLHDAVYATDEDNCAINDYFVIYSPGESGKDDLYFRIRWVSDYFQVHGFLSWDNITHAGSSINYATASNFYVEDAGTPEFYVYGSLKFLSLINKRATGDYRSCLFGRGSKAWDHQSEEVAICSSTLTAGSDVSITVDAMPSNWAVGKDIYIRTTHNDDMSTTKVEKITIKTLDTLIITADLVNSYTADSALTDQLCYMCQDSFTLWSTTKALILPSGAADNQVVTLAYNSSLVPTYHDPSDFEETIGLYTPYVLSTAGVLGLLPNIKRTPTQNAAFTSEDILTEDNGNEWRCFKIYSSVYMAFLEV